MVGSDFGKEISSLFIIDTDNLPYIIGKRCQILIKTKFLKNHFTFEQNQFEISGKEILNPSHIEMEVD